MAKGSQTQKNEALSKIKKKIHSFEHIEALEFIAKLPVNWIPPEVANVPQNKDNEIKKFLLCFDHLNERECKLDSFNPSRARALIQTLKQITDCEVRHRHTIIRDKINNVPGPYLSLFSNLTPDVSLFEIEFSGSGRIFFFDFMEKINIVSIEDTHRNID